MADMKKALFLFNIALFIFAGCTSTSNVESAKIQAVSRNLTDKGVKNQEQLYNFFLSHNPNANKKTVKKIASLYIDEAEAEGINSDCAFVQMCHETGFLRFGGLVTKEMNNFCGLGSEGNGKNGASFPSMKIGVRAHIQHLQAYATTENKKLKNKVVDPRYSWPHKAYLAQTIFDLTGKWATDPEYADKLDKYLSELEKF